MIHDTNYKSSKIQCLLGNAIHFAFPDNFSNFPKENFRLQQSILENCTEKELDLFCANLVMQGIIMDIAFL